MMKLFLSFSFFTCCIFRADAEQQFVTHQITQGRFGENVLTYLHAKWISFEYQLPLLYQPFAYSNQLVLDDIELRYKEHNNLIEAKVDLWGRSLTAGLMFDAPDWRGKEKTHLLQQMLEKGNPPSVAAQVPCTLYICPFFPENVRDCFSTEQVNEPSPFRGFSTNWDHPEFRKTVSALVAPKNALKLTRPPEGFISIALHVREGGGYDSVSAKGTVPMKFPPMSFYIEGLQKMMDLFPGETLYCYLFTDARSPAPLAEQILAGLPKDAPLVMDYRASDNHHSRNVVEDFCSLFEFDALIYPISAFSQVPGLIHDYAAVFYPVAFSRTPTLTIHSTLKVNEEVYNQLMQTR